MKIVFSNFVKHYFIIIVIYVSLFFIALFNLVNPSLFLNVLFALLFITSFIFQYIYLKKSYKRYCTYSKKKLLLLSIIFFVATDLICKIPDLLDVNNYALVILCSYSAILLSESLVCLSLYFGQKHPNIAKGLFFFSVLQLLLANVVSIIRLFFPVS